jgi:16S rRNA (cytosine967-C5)-methyltransferase
VPADPRDVVLEVLARVATDGAHASVALDRALAALARPEDRSFATDVVYGTLRWAPARDAALSARLRDPDALPARVRAALRAGTYERCVRGTPAHAAVHAWVEAIKRGRGPDGALAGLVNAVLRRVDLEDAERRGGAAAAAALPPALWRHLSAALGAEDAAAAARAMLAPAPLWLTELGVGAVAALEAEGAEVRPGPLPTSWSVRPRRPLAELRAFRDGLVQPQNPSSAAIVAALGDVRGRTVLDVGSGHGVKAAQLAAAGARVLALEIDARRSEAGRRNLARLGFEVRHVVADATEPLAGLPQVDAALLDAPCTGTGTLRGHPEIKQRWTEGDLHRAAERQARMVRQVAARVRPGGRLVYAVCALGREEGEDVVAGFLAEAPDWRAAAVALPLPTRPADVGARILPTAEGLDGFYVAVLERSAALRDDEAAGA